MRLLEEEEGVMVPLVKWETMNLIPLALALALALAVLVVDAVVVDAVVATFELTIGIGVVLTVLTVAVIVAVIVTVVAVNKLVCQHVEAEASQILFLADQLELATCI
jgi:hypothetical protein